MVKVNVVVPSIHNLKTRLRWMISCMPHLLHQKVWTPVSSRKEAKVQLYCACCGRERTLCFRKELIYDFTHLPVYSLSGGICHTLRKHSLGQGMCSQSMADSHWNISVEPSDHTDQGILDAWKRIIPKKNPNSWDKYNIFI